MGWGGARTLSPGTLGPSGALRGSQCGGGCGAVVGPCSGRGGGGERTRPRAGRGRFGAAAAARGSFGIWGPVEVVESDPKARSCFWELPLPRPAEAGGAAASPSRVSLGLVPASGKTLGHAGDALGTPWLLSWVWRDAEAALGFGVRRPASSCWGRGDCGDRSSRDGLTLETSFLCIFLFLIVYVVCDVQSL